MTDNIMNIKNGKFFRIAYQSNKDSIDGSVLRKVTEVTARTGINPTHRKDYIAPANPRKANPNDEVIKPFSIKRNANTGNTLFGIYPVWNGAKVTYYKDGEEVSKDVFTASEKPSKHSGNIPEYITVNIVNILSVKQK